MDGDVCDAHHKIIDKLLDTLKPLIIINLTARPNNKTNEEHQMSITACKYINYCFTNTKTADLLIGLINNKEVRKNWRNADVFARFLVDTVANAYQCENSSTFEENGYSDMDDAIYSYVEANLGDWNQERFLESSFGKLDSQDISDRLAEQMYRNAAFEKKASQPVGQTMQNHFFAMTAEDQALSVAHDYKLALYMNKVIECGQGLENLHKVNQEFCVAARARWMERRKPIRDAACGYKDAFHAFHCHADMDSFTEVCRAWLAMLDEAQRLNDAVDKCAANNSHEARMTLSDGDLAYVLAVANRIIASTPIVDARNNAHYYELLLRKRTAKGELWTTVKHLAYEYLLNDAIAGDMVKRADLHRNSILFRDGSWLDLRDGHWMEHGFYLHQQDKLC